MKDKTWVLVAESSRARLFARRGRKLVELRDFAHPESRLHNRDIDADKPGRAFDSAGHGRHAMEPGSSAKRVQAEAFARELAESLEQARARAQFEQLMIAAPPEFLGMLREAMPAELAECVERTVAKRLVNEEPTEIYDQLDLP